MNYKNKGLTVVLIGRQHFTVWYKINDFYAKVIELCFIVNIAPKIYSYSFTVTNTTINNNTLRSPHKQFPSSSAVVWWRCQSYGLKPYSTLRAESPKYWLNISGWAWENCPSRRFLSLAETFVFRCMLFSKAHSSCLVFSLVESVYVLLETCWHVTGPERNEERKGTVNETTDQIYINCHNHCLPVTSGWVSWTRPANLSLTPLCRAPGIWKNKDINPSFDNTMQIKNYTSVQFPSFLPYTEAQLSWR